MADITDNPHTEDADERFAANYDRYADGLAEFMRQAMRHFAFARLG